MSIVSFNGMLVKKTFNIEVNKELIFKIETPELFNKRKESLTEYLSGKSRTRRELKYLAKLAVTNS